MTTINMHTEYALCPVMAIVWEVLEYLSTEIFSFLFIALFRPRLQTDLNVVTPFQSPALRGRVVLSLYQGAFKRFRRFLEFMWLKCFLLTVLRSR